MLKPARGQDHQRENRTAQRQRSQSDGSAGRRGTGDAPGGSTKALAGANWWSIAPVTFTAALGIAALAAGLA